MSRVVRGSSRCGTWLPTPSSSFGTYRVRLITSSHLSYFDTNRRQPGQTSTTEVAKRDLRAELLVAEAEARERKRKAEGKPALTVENATTIEGQDEESNKRRKLLQEALELDKDDDDEEENEDEDECVFDLFVIVTVDLCVVRASRDVRDDDDDEEDDTAELLRELEKIKRERAEEKERQEQEQSASQQAQREADIATSNPLLNLAAALGQTPNGVNTTKPGTFAVKRRWDDGQSFPLDLGVRGNSHSARRQTSSSRTRR